MLQDQCGLSENRTIKNSNFGEDTYMVSSRSVSCLVSTGNQWLAFAFPENCSCYGKIHFHARVSNSGTPVPGPDETLVVWLLSLNTGTCKEWGGRNVTTVYNGETNGDIRLLLDRSKYRTRTSAGVCGLKNSWSFMKRSIAERLSLYDSIWGWWCQGT